MKKRKLMGLMATGLLVASLNGCMPSSNSSSAETTAVQATEETKSQDNLADEEVSIRMNWWGGDTRHQATLAGIAAFEENNPNIHVSAEYEAFSGHEEKIALALNAGTAADVLQMDMDWVFNYSPRGDMFVDLNTVSDVLDLTAYEQSALDFFTINGSLQAVPIANTVRVFYWNQATLDKVGATIPSTLDELIAMGEQFAAYEDGSYYPLVLRDYEKIELLVYYLQSVYGKNWIEDYVLQYTKEEIVEGLEFLSLLEEKHVFPSSEKLAGDGSEEIDGNQNWIDGHYAGIYMWDTNLQKHQEALLEGECVIGPMITMGDYNGGMIKVSQALSIPASSEYPRESAMLIEFLFGSEEGVKLLGDTRGVPANKKALAALDLSESVSAQANKIGSDWSEFFMDVTFQRAALRNSGDGVYSLVLQSLSYKEADAETCADMLIEGINSELEAAQK